MTLFISRDNSFQEVHHSDLKSRKKSERPQKTHKPDAWLKLFECLPLVVQIPYHIFYGKQSDAAPFFVESYNMYITLPSIRCFFFL